MAELNRFEASRKVCTSFARYFDAVISDLLALLSQDVDDVRTSTAAKSHQQHLYWSCGRTPLSVSLHNLGVSAGTDADKKVVSSIMHSCLRLCHDSLSFLLASAKTCT